MEAARREGRKAPESLVARMEAAEGPDPDRVPSWLPAKGMRLPGKLWTGMWNRPRRESPALSGCSSPSGFS